MRPQLLSLCLLAGALRPLAGQAQPAPVRVLFVGNSFTHGKFDPVRLYNAASASNPGGVVDENYQQTGARAENYAGPWGGIPGLFKKFADQAGLSYEVHIESISGQPLEYHYRNALAVVRQASWDKVVLQDQSIYPLPTARTGNRTSFYTYATNLERAVHGQNAQAQVYLYETWARADLTYPSNQPYSGFPIDTMGQDLHNGYYAQFAANGRYARVAPAGDAWLRAIRENIATRDPYHPDASKLNLWGSDYYHPSNSGSYLNACVLFYTLTGLDPRTLGSGEQAAAALGLSAPAATALQQVAYEQVSGAPLPVELVAFTARPAGPAVLLGWTTASELRSAHFVVERSSDGQHFAAVGTVAAAGSSAAARSYSYADAAAPAGLLYYRLQQTDQDGTFTYSPVRTVPARTGQWQLYPNPAPNGRAVLGGVAPGTVVRVLDPLGRVVQTATATPAGAATLTSLPAGMYVVQAGTTTTRLSVE